VENLWKSFVGLYGVHVRVRVCAPGHWVALSFAHLPEIAEFLAEFASFRVLPSLLAPKSFSFRSARFSRLQRVFLQSGFFWYASRALTSACATDI
jgi:hypothetical protein